MKIRKYKPDDQEQLRYICRATTSGFFCSNKKRLETVSIIYSDYFTECEPENIFVLADDEDKAVGYILCAADYNRFDEQCRKVYLKKVQKIDFISGILYRAYLVRAKEVAPVPHLHIDLLPEAQRQGWGSKMIDTLRAHLKENGYQQLSICSIDRRGSAYPFYHKYGFKDYRTTGKNIVSLIIDL